jgi:hypothetical protein
MSAVLGALGGIGGGLLSAIGSIGSVLIDIAKYLFEIVAKMANWFMENPEKGLVGVGILWALLSP